MKRQKTLSFKARNLFLKIIYDLLKFLVSFRIGCQLLRWPTHTVIANHKQPSIWMFAKTKAIFLHKYRTRKGLCGIHITWKCYMKVLNNLSRLYILLSVSVLYYLYLYCIIFLFIYLFIFIVINQTCLKQPKYKQRVYHVVSLDPIMV